MRVRRDETVLVPGTSLKVKYIILISGHGIVLLLYTLTVNVLYNKILDSLDFD